MKLKSVVPESPSLSEMSSMVMVAASSLMIVPKPVVSPIATRLASELPSNKAFDKSTVNVSSISTIVSPTTLTVTVVEFVPAAITAGWAVMVV